MSNRPVLPPRRQRGIVLMVVMIMLVMITLLAVMTLGTATTEQKIAATSNFQNMGFQGAESAIDDAINRSLVSNSQSSLATFSAALTSTAPITLTLNLGSTPVTATSQTSYLGNAAAITGYSLGGQSQFAAYNFLIQGTGTVNGVNLSAVTAQGVYRIAPTAGTNN